VRAREIGGEKKSCTEEKGEDWEGRTGGRETKKGVKWGKNGAVEDQGGKGSRGNHLGQWDLTGKPGRKKGGEGKNTKNFERDVTEEFGPKNLRKVDRSRKENRQKGKKRITYTVLLISVLGEKGTKKGMSWTLWRKKGGGYLKQLKAKE